MIRFIKDLFCYHKWKEIAGIYDSMYLGSLSKCKKCGKMKEDPLLRYFDDRYIQKPKGKRIYHKEYLKRGYDD